MSHLLEAPTLQWAPAWSCRLRAVLHHAALPPQPHRASAWPRPALAPSKPLSEAIYYKLEPLVPTRPYENQRIHRVLAHVLNFLNVSGDSEPSTLFGFENAIHVTKSVTESLAVWVSLVSLRS